MTESTRLGKHSPKWKEWLDLKNPRKRRQAAKMLVQGTRLLEELLASRCQVDCLLYCPELLDQRSEALLQRFSGCKYETDLASLKRISETENCPGLLAVAQQPDWTRQSLSQFNSLLVLDGLSDPGNIGTLIRTARAAGIQAVVCNGGADPYSSKTIRSSAGACFYIPIIENQALHQIMDEGFTVVQTVVQGGLDLYSVPWDSRTAVVLGNESHGVKLDFARALRVTIPMEADCESLNVSTAGAILLYEWRRRLNQT